MGVLIMAYTFNQLLDLVSLASQMLIWVRCVDDPRSVNGFYVFLGPNIVSWSSRKQKVRLQGPTPSLDSKHWLTQQQRVACITAKLVTHARTQQMEVDVHFFNILKVELNVKVSPFHLRWHV
ncbi:hypothetical protein CK203_096859 [Vitis vinifera]|uniref:Mitochondrial protein n=1 Tax=Vitis vinifera TaxID=29760 RepID=A0A438BPN7_VITVI|nr:hypothetical protein CK203_096859 [Vitis vinifera]